MALNIAYSYSNGIGAEKTEEKAFETYLKSVDFKCREKSSLSGNINAQYQENGMGVDKSRI
ncbi:hypothetical protein Glove_469g28 [Diversispora epigaea]|uniref:Uncharacterized protein n=1 Tax=Diversispora epigaea TaxID=1348612 RepID=A0A397GLB8_9GLOM|nr:hypothetical protein Glove_469g28 [Diversispora epigaea]